MKPDIFNLHHSLSIQKDPYSNIACRTNFLNKQNWCCILVSPFRCSPIINLPFPETNLTFSNQVERNFGSIILKDWIASFVCKHFSNYIVVLPTLCPIRWATLRESQNLFIIEDWNAIIIFIVLIHKFYNFFIEDWRTVITINT